jgi:hypothetical protein
MPATGPSIQVMPQVQTSQGALALWLASGLRLIGGLAHDLAWWQTGKFFGIAGIQHGQAFSRTQLVGGFWARHERPLIRVDLAVACPAPQSAVADLPARRRPGHDARQQ